MKGPATRDDLKFEACRQAVRAEDD